MHHRGLLEHWCLWQAADFCVAHRLRTPIGKPVDTFMCIEAAIKHIAADNKALENGTKSGGGCAMVTISLSISSGLIGHLLFITHF